MNTELTYCGICLVNYEDEQFDYRFDKPICLICLEPCFCSQCCSEGHCGCSECKEPCTC